MNKRTYAPVAETVFSREYQLHIDNFIIEKGDIVKVKGEYGTKFKFHSLVTNNATGSQWVDCFEIQRGTATAYRSFKIDKIKRIPVKRGRKNVN
jgi:hypothetical protein